MIQVAGQPGPRVRDSGFTLIEMLVSLTLLAMLLAIVPGTLRLGRRVWEKADQKTEAIERSTFDFATATLETALPLFVRDTFGLQTLAFSGTPEVLSYVTELRNGPAGGGLYRITIDSRVRATPDVIVQIAPFSGDNVLATGVVETRHLGLRIISARFRFFGPVANGEVSLWNDQWLRTDRLPDLVEVTSIVDTGKNQTTDVRRIQLRLRSQQ